MIIKSERLILRSWKDTDINDLVEGLNNIEVANSIGIKGRRVKSNDS